MPDRVNGHYGQATLVPRPSELLCGVAAGHGAMTALEEDRWSTCCTSGHGLGLRLFGGLFYPPDPRARPRYLALSGRTLPDYKGTGGPLFVPDSRQFFFGRRPLRFFKNRAS